MQRGSLTAEHHDMSREPTALRQLTAWLNLKTMSQRFVDVSAKHGPETWPYVEAAEYLRAAAVRFAKSMGT